MNPSSKAHLPRSAPKPIKPDAESVDSLATTINQAIDQAEELGISSAVQLLMMARLEVDLTEIALQNRPKNGA